MPELPEVETIKRQIERHLKGQVISDIIIYNPKSFIGYSKLVIGQKIIEVKRYGKMLVIKLSNNYDLGIHLKMSGQLIYVGRGYSTSPRLRGASRVEGRVNKEKIHKHTRVIIEFKSSDRLLFNDQRKFGWIRVFNHKEILSLPFIKKLGPEPWDIKDELFYEKLHKKNKPIKTVLTDQDVISGVGNIYANDALWEAGIDPKKKAKSLTKEEAWKLREALVKVLEEGIKLGGSTGKDRKYIDFEGNSGKYLERSRVYERDKLKCKRDDGGIIEKIKIGGRGTYFCPVCQK